MNLFSLLAGLLVSCLALGCDQKLAKGNLSDYGRFGRSIGVFGTTTVIGAYQEASESGAAYVFATPGSVLGPEARLLPADPGLGDQFGDAVAAGAGLAVVSAPLKHQPGAVRAGAVYVFERTGSGWTQQAKLGPPSAQAWQGFGHSLALDGITLVVGSPARDVGGASDAGAAYVYQRSGSSWVLNATLTAPTSATSDYFGSDVAVLGDRVFVGASGRNSGRTQNCGAVFVYQRVRGTWSLSQTLLASDRAHDDRLGSSLAVTEVNGLRYLISGAAGADHAGLSNPGAAYVFAENMLGTFAQHTKLTATDPANNASFGGDSAASGARFVVGAPGLNQQTGAGYVFDLVSGVLTPTTKLTPHDAIANDLVGISVAVSVLGVMLGATGTDIDPARVDAGAVHLFSQAAGWTETLRFSAAERTAMDRFTQDVAIHGAWGAVAHESGVDVLRRDAQYWSLTQRLAAASGYQPTLVALHDDRLAIMYRRPGTPPIARLEIFARTPNQTWQLEQALIPDLVSAAFANESANTPSLSLSATHLVLGAPRFNGGDGRVLIYRRTGNTWAETQVFGSDWAASAIDQNFGRWVVHNETTLAISEVPNINEPTAVPKHGRVHVYDSIDGDFVWTETITAPVPVDVDFFGRGLALSTDGRLAVVGENATLRVYDRVDGSYVPTWETSPVLGLHSYPDLDFDAERLAVGVPGATHSALVNAGEVQVFLREPGGSWALERTERAGDAASGQGLGTRLGFDGGRMLVGTDPLDVGHLYTF